MADIAGKVVAITGASSGIGETAALLLTSPEIETQTLASMDNMPVPPDAIARAIAFAIEQPADVDVGEIVVRPTAPG